MLERLSSRPIAVVAVIVAVAVAAYASVVTSPFALLDDPLYILNNPRVQNTSLRGFLAIWSPTDALHGRFIEFFPLRDTVYWTLWALFGKNAVPFHIVSIVVHAIASVLVSRLAKALGATTTTALVAGAIFAAHPIHIESVAWIAGLKDPLYVTFMLMACLAWLRGLEEDGVKSAATHRRRALLWMAAGLLCKSMAFVIPALLAVFALTHRRRPPPLTLLRWLFAPAVVAMAFVALFLVVGRANDVITQPTGGNWWTHYQVVAWVSARYLQQALLPMDFRLHYCFDIEGSMVAVRAIIGACAIAAYAFVCVRARKSPLALRLLLWGPIALFPVMNIVPFPALMADRYLYAASAAVCIGAAWVLMAIPSRIREPITVAVIVVLLGVTGTRGALWHTPVDLWQPVADDPLCADAAYPLINLGQAHARAGDNPRAALEAFHAAMNKPAFRRIIPLMKCDAHVQAASQALRLTPANAQLAQRHERAASLVCPADDPDLIAVRADIAASSNDADAALAAADAAVVAKPNDAGLVWNRGLARLQVGRIDDGRADLETALRGAPDVVCPLARAALANPDELATPGATPSPDLVAGLGTATDATCGPTPPISSPETANGR